LTDLYAVLEIKKDATQEEIQKSYRTMAKKYHPDVSKEEDTVEKFKEVSAAFEVLKDPQKRAEYDRFGTNSKPYRSAMDDFFGSIFGGGGPFGGGGGPFGPQRHQQCGRNIALEHEVTFDQVLNGGEVSIVFKRRDLCPECKGSGGEKGECPECKGSCFRIIRGPNMTVKAPCDMCNGTGKTVTKQCKSCIDGFTEAVDHTIKFQIHKGVEHGMRFRCAGQGEPVHEGRQGDLFIIINVKPHKTLERLPNGNILYKVPVTYTQLILGADLEVPGLEGSHSVTIPAGTQCNEQFTLEGKGLPVFTNGRSIYKHGDQLIQIELEIPNKLDDGYKEIIKKLAEFEIGG